MEPRENNGRYVYIENDDITDIMFRNFAGAPDKFHQNGQQPNCWLALKEEKAQELLDKGLNVRTFTNRDGDPEYRIQIFANYLGKLPPTIYKKCGNNKMLLDEDSVCDLDRDEIISVNVKISPYHWEFNGNSGCKAYISKAMFEILEDRIDMMLSDGFDDPIEEDLPWN